jgi:hypothetical protein
MPSDSRRLQDTSTRAVVLLTPDLDAAFRRYLADTAFLNESVALRALVKTGLAALAAE